MRGVNSVLLIGRQVGPTREDQGFFWFVLATERYGANGRTATDNHLVYATAQPPGGPGSELIVEGHLRTLGSGQHKAVEAVKVAEA
jgi:hypothetical protein